jgi:type I restriction enzyme S subunit
MTARTVELGSFLTAAARNEPVDRTAVYSMMGVRSFGRGPFAAEALHGDSTSYTTLRRVSEGDVVYPKLMAWEGAFAIVPEDLDGRWVSPEFCVFEVNESLADRDYVAHLVAWEGLREGLLGQSSGTNARRRRLQPHAFLAHQVSLPGLTEQRRAADYLNRFQHAALETTSSESAHIDRLDQIIEDAIREESSGISVNIGSLLERDRNWLEPEEGETYSPIGIRGFGRGIIHYPEIPRQELAKLRFYNVHPLRLLVSNIKAWEGAVALTKEEDGCRIASNRFLQYRLTASTTSLEWIRTYLLSRAGIAQLEGASPGSADRNRTLSMVAFESIMIPVPSVERQAAILAVVDHTEALGSVRRRRLALANALLPAARNEVFSALR